MWIAEVRWEKYHIVGLTSTVQWFLFMQSIGPEQQTIWIDHHHSCE